MVMDYWFVAILVNCDSFLELFHLFAKVEFLDLWGLQLLQTDWLESRSQAHLYVVIVISQSQIRQLEDIKEVRRDGQLVLGHPLVKKRNEGFGVEVEQSDYLSQVYVGGGCDQGRVYVDCCQGGVHELGRQIHVFDVSCYI